MAGEDRQKDTPESGGEMDASRKPTPLQELKAFIQFLQHLWATLAGISIFFPLSNTFTKIVPLAQWDEGGFAYLATNLVSALASLACLFTVLWMFANRGVLRARDVWEALPRRALGSFALGVLSLIIYLIGHYLISSDFYFAIGLESDDMIRITGDIVLLLAYCGFFAFVTRAFLFLGLREYLTPREDGD